MAVYRIFQNSAFDPTDIEAMSAAFEDVCRDLGFAVKDSVLRDIIAKVSQERTSGHSLLDHVVGGCVL